ncbi:S1 RNA-binding domain-containing protein [Streptomyces sp. NPDC048623]|uniref:S1 RNA-binding domain-containing protein n=1 Tax=Streptomyces sp. NPDC048623 TaxID=3155761 RepID=UPI003416D8D1
MDWQPENPELWAFLESLRQGEVVSGTISAIERFGVFVALDNSPSHPAYPGAGFIAIPELSWRHIDDPADVVEVGDGIEGLVPSAEVHGRPASGPAETLRPGDKATFVVTDMERPQRRLLLSRGQEAPALVEPDKP